jgi:hypothetical protein
MGTKRRSDDRSLRDALDNFHASAAEDYADGKQLIRRAATSALTFTTFS